MSRRLRTVAAFELRYHGREFLTGVYVAVFFLLTFGFTASSAVELVGARGAAPRNAPWIIAQAMAGVTAFGQVITAMIAATAVLRDRAARTEALLVATPLSRTEYLAGRFAGAVLVMLLVYLAIPLGALAGALVGGAQGDALLPFDARTYLTPWLLLVVPNVLCVSALLFAAGTLGGGLGAVLATALALMVLWQTGSALAADAATRWAGALLDPFGNAALAAATAGWTAAERAGRQVPWGAELLANRALWLGVAAVAAGVTIRRGETRGSDAVPHPSSPDAPSPQPPAPRLDAPRYVRRGVGGWGLGAYREEGEGGSSFLSPLLTEATFTTRWLLSERAYFVLALLAALNAAANAWRAAGGGIGAVTSAVELHSRLFLVLLATIYAGELVWRDRDLRAAELRDALPVSRAAMVPGRALGAAAAFLPLLLVLLAVALGVHAVQGGGITSDAVARAAAVLLGDGYPSLVRLLLLSLLVHAVVQHKVLAHVLLITGWVVAAALAARGAGAWLPRYTFLPDMQRALDGAAPTPVERALVNAVALLCLAGAVLAWQRGTEGRRA